MNSRLDPVQAAVLRVKLHHLDAWTQRRQAIADLYLAALAGADLILPHVPDWAKPAWHLFVVRSQARESLQARLAQASIGSLIHYPIPPHMQVAYAGMGLAAEALPLARQLANDVISLPIGPQMPLTDALTVVWCLTEV